jgi:hypothetical protein
VSGWLDSREKGGRGGRTCVYLSADYERGVTDAGLDHGTVLRRVVDDLVFPPFNVLAGCGVPGVGEEGEGFEFVACEWVSMCISLSRSFIDSRWEGREGTHPSTTSCLDSAGRGLFEPCSVALGIVLCIRGSLR